jgi:hypothetical protein
VPRTGQGESEVHHVTDAATAHSDDLDARITKYLISMFIRTACVLLVFVVDGWLRWVFAVGAIGLPYVAVVRANNGGRQRGRPARVTAVPLTPLPGPGGRATTAGRPDGEPPVVLTGVVQPRADERPARAPADGAGAAERPAQDPRSQGPRTVPGTTADPLRDSA